MLAIKNGVRESQGPPSLSPLQLWTASAHPSPGCSPAGVDEQILPSQVAPRWAQNHPRGTEKLLWPEATPLCGLCRKTRGVVPVVLSRCFSARGPHRLLGRPWPTVQAPVWGGLLRDTERLDKEAAAGGQL